MYFWKNPLNVSKNPPVSGPLRSCLRASSGGDNFGFLSKIIGFLNNVRAWEIETHATVRHGGFWPRSGRFFFVIWADFWFCATKISISRGENNNFHPKSYFCVSIYHDQNFNFLVQWDFNLPGPWFSIYHEHHHFEFTTFQFTVTFKWDFNLLSDDFTNHQPQLGVSIYQVGEVSIFHDHHHFEFIATKDFNLPQTDVSPFNIVGENFIPQTEFQFTTVQSVWIQFIDIHW